MIPNCSQINTIKAVLVIPPPAIIPQLADQIQKVNYNNWDNNKFRH